MSSDEDQTRKKDSGPNYGEKRNNVRQIVNNYENFGNGKKKEKQSDPRIVTSSDSDNEKPSQKKKPVFDSDSDDSSSRGKKPQNNSNPKQKNDSDEENRKQIQKQIDQQTKKKNQKEANKNQQTKTKENPTKPESEEKHSLKKLSDAEKNQRMVKEMNDYKKVLSEKYGAPFPSHTDSKQTTRSQIYALPGAAQVVQEEDRTLRKLMRSYKKHPNRYFDSDVEEDTTDSSDSDNEKPKFDKNMDKELTKMGEVFVDEAQKLNQTDVWYVSPAGKYKNMYVGKLLFVRASSEEEAKANIIDFLKNKETARTNKSNKNYGKFPSSNSSAGSKIHDAFIKQIKNGNVEICKVPYRTGTVTMEHYAVTEKARDKSNKSKHKSKKSKKRNVSDSSDSSGSEASSSESDFGSDSD